MRIGYVRVSSVDQNEERQIEGLKQYKIDKWYREKASAKDTNRPQLQAMLDFARTGDTIYILDFSRLARSTKDLLHIVESLRDKSIELYSHKEQIDTSTPTGKLMLTMVAAINEFERMNLLERQREGILLAKKKGIYKGRKKIEKPDNWEEVMELWRSRRIKSREAWERLGLKKSTFYSMLKQEQEEGQK